MKALKRNLLLVAGAILFSSCVSDKDDMGLYGDGFQQSIMVAKNQVFPAVVYIRGINENLAHGRKVSGTALGSGVIISETGEVLTNWHVVDKLKNIRCQLSDGRGYKAEVIGKDKDMDIALVQLKLKPGEKLTNVATISEDPKMTEGNFVMAMGAPWGLNRSVSIGIISCAKRYLPGNSLYSVWYQVDAAINPGNSGGPLVDSKGNVIGVITLGMNNANSLGFAKPTTIVSKIIPRLRKYGHVNWAWTGLKLQPLHDFNTDISFDYDNGVIVANVDEDSPAQKADIRAMDRIVAINDEEVTAKNRENTPAINAKLALLPFGQEMKLTVKRGDKTLVKHFKPIEKGEAQGQELELKRWNMSVKSINQFDSPELYFYHKKGVYVYGVERQGNAANSRLHQKDIIISVDNQPIESLDQFKTVYDKCVANVASKSKVILSVMRGGTVRQVILDYDRDYAAE